MALQEAIFNPLLHEAIAAEVLQHLSTQERIRVAFVCRLWRAHVAENWTTVHLPGPNAYSQLAW